MWRSLIILAACATAPRSRPPIANAGGASPPRAMVGRWRVVGCETSPQDPADCARGEIVFTADRVTIDVPASDHTPRPYTVVSSTRDRIVLRIDQEDSELAIGADGAATWRAPGFDGRVGALTFERVPER